MRSTTVHRNGNKPEIGSNDSKHEVSPTMRVAGDTDGITDQNSNRSVSAELRTPLKQHTAATASKRMNPDSRGFIRLIIAGVIVAGLVAFAISFVSLYSVAEWLGLPRWMWWAVPTFIDLAILVYAGLVLVHRSRGEKTGPSWAALGAFTLLSVIANGAHALSHQHDAQWQAYIGVLIAAMVPIAIFVATEQLSRVAIEDLNSRKAELQDQVDLEMFEAEQQRKREELAFEREQRQLEREQALIRTKQAWELDQRKHQHKLESISDGPSPDSSPQQAKPTTVLPQPSEQPSKNSPPASEESLLEFVRECLAQDAEVTGGMVANFLGVSDRTGRRRIKELQDKYPEMFLMEKNADQTHIDQQADRRS